jgi:Trk K+ transport system NAD-binding subunit
LFADEALSVDVWISPEQLVTEYIEQLIKFPARCQVLDFADGRVRLVGIRARKGGLLVGQKLAALKEHHPSTEARVVAIYRAGRSVKPEGETVIEENDEVFFIAARDDIRKFMSEIRKEEAPAKRVVIAGGGNIGLSLARRLEEVHHVKLIERDPKRARRISEILLNTIVLNGDAADEELLIEENIDSCDVFASLTNSEEANILSAMLAKRLPEAWPDQQASTPISWRAATSTSRFRRRPSPLDRCWRTCDAATWCACTPCAAALPRRSRPSCTAPTRPRAWSAGASATFRCPMAPPSARWCAATR